MNDPLSGPRCLVYTILISARTVGTDRPGGDPRQLIVPLPARLSVSDAARIARAVSVAIERECGFVVEARLEPEAANVKGSDDG